MNTVLRAKPHPDRPGEIVIEAHYGGQLIGTIAGRANGPGFLFVGEAGVTLGNIEKTLWRIDARKENPDGQASPRSEAANGVKPEAAPS